MVDAVRKQNWSAGANNIAPRDRMPEGAVRAAVNMDPNVGGTFTLRAGYERLYEGQAVRGVLALGERLLIADGEDLVEFDLGSNSHRVIRQIAASGRFVGDEHAGRLYLCTENECLEYDGSVIRPWGVPDVLMQPQVVALAQGGALQAGHYRVAVTYTDAWGREGGTDKPLIIAVGAGGVLQVTLPVPPAGCTLNLYCSARDSATLYRQGSYAAGGPVAVGSVRDDTERLESILQRAPVPGDHVLSHNGVLLIADRHVLWQTVPMSPHLVHRRSGFFQFPAEIGALLSDGSVFVSADRCYAISGIETATPEQRVVLDVPAIPGTAVKLPDGRGAWMTRYGQALTVDGMTMQFPNRPAFAVPDHTEGAAGVLEHNGNQMIVTSARGGAQNGLAASDYFYGEILNR